MNQQYCVIMAGGIGSRFWPMSTIEHPKQFMDILGMGKSLLQMTFERFTKIIPIENIFVVTHTPYREKVLEQLPLLKPDQVLAEPQRRNTAPCIAYASAHIKCMDPKATIVVTPSDHVIHDTELFNQAIREGLEFASHEDALFTIGIPPHRPETGYGYIQVEGDDACSGLQKVRTFIEKPNREMAQIFLESGEFLWNSGIFIWNVATIEKAFQKYLPEIKSKFNRYQEVYGHPSQENFVNQAYASCKSTSIDYGIMEKAQNVFVLCAEFGWADLGTWSSLYEHSPKDRSENVKTNGKVMLYNSKDNLIHLPNGKMLVLESLSDYIIADSEKVLLICPREKEKGIRQYMTDIKVNFENEDYL